jgi:hypothetical protein
MDNRNESVQSAGVKSVKPPFRFTHHTAEGFLRDVKIRSLYGAIDEEFRDDRGRERNGIGVLPTKKKGWNADWISCPSLRPTFQINSLELNDGGSN